MITKQQIPWIAAGGLIFIALVSLITFFNSIYFQQQVNTKKLEVLDLNVTNLELRLYGLREERATEIRGISDKIDAIDKMRCMI
jgi:hypothetical protein